MSKFDYMKRVRNAGTEAEVKAVMVEINQAYVVDKTMTEETYNAIFAVCLDKIVELNK